MSEGRNQASLLAFREAAGDLLLDVHTDPDHHRSVLTLCSAQSSAGTRTIDGEASRAIRSALGARVRQIATAAVGIVDLRDHEGAHPRLGSLDVVPFVSLRREENGRVRDGPVDEAIVARDEFVAWAASELGLPCFAYGPERSLPDVRRNAFRSLRPDAGPPEPHATAGSCAVGARPLLVAYNLWLCGSSHDGAEARELQLQTARSIAGAIRQPAVRALGLRVGSQAQVSINLIDPFHIGPERVYDLVARLAEKSGTAIDRAELVGLAPMQVLVDSTRHRLAELGLDEEHTIEATLESRQ